MRADAIRYLLLNGLRDWRAHLAPRLKASPVGRPLRALAHGVARVRTSRLVAPILLRVRRRIYAGDPHGYWRREGGRKYLQDEAYILGAGSITERQGRFLADELRALGARTVLEVGCGYGRVLRELRGAVDARLVGVDFSLPQLVTAREYLGARRPPLVLADATRGLPFRDGAFDVVYTQGSLMHVPPPGADAYRQELVRVARYVVHTEEAQDTDIVFAHDNPAWYASHGCRTVKSLPYPLNLPGQAMRFEVFERGRG